MKNSIIILLLAACLLPMGVYAQAQDHAESSEIRGPGGTQPMPADTGIQKPDPITDGGTAVPGAPVVSGPTIDQKADGTEASNPQKIVIVKRSIQVSQTVINRLRSMVKDQLKAGNKTLASQLRKEISTQTKSIQGLKNELERLETSGTKGSIVNNYNFSDPVTPPAAATTAPVAPAATTPALITTPTGGFPKMNTAGMNSDMSAVWLWAILLIKIVVIAAALGLVAYGVIRLIQLIPTRARPAANANGARTGAEAAELVEFNDAFVGIFVTNNGGGAEDRLTDKVTGSASFTINTRHAGRQNATFKKS